MIHILPLSEHCLRIRSLPAGQAGIQIRRIMTRVRRKNKSVNVLTCIMQGIIIDTYKELEITVPACGRQVDIEFKKRF